MWRYSSTAAPTSAAGSTAEPSAVSGSPNVNPHTAPQDVIDDWEDVLGQSVDEPDTLERVPSYHTVDRHPGITRAPTYQTVQEGSGDNSRPDDIISLDSFGESDTDNRNLEVPSRSATVTPTPSNQEKEKDDTSVPSTARSAYVEDGSGDGLEMGKPSKEKEKPIEDAKKPQEHEQDKAEEQQPPADVLLEVVYERVGAEGPHILRKCRYQTPTGEVVREEREDIKIGSKLMTGQFEGATAIYKGYKTFGFQRGQNQLIVSTDYITMDTIDASGERCRMNNFGDDPTFVLHNAQPPETVFLNIPGGDIFTMPDGLSSGGAGMVGFEAALAAGERALEEGGRMLADAEITRRNALAGAARELQRAEITRQNALAGAARELQRAEITRQNALAGAARELQRAEITRQNALADAARERANARRVRSQAGSVSTFNLGGTSFSGVVNQAYNLNISSQTIYTYMDDSDSD